MGDAFNAGFYEEQASLRKLPLLESRPKRFMRNLAARDVLTSKKVLLDVPPVVRCGAELWDS